MTSTRALPDSTHVFRLAFPPAQNVTWKSINFKTVLTWGPAPTANYSYTDGEGPEKEPHCIKTSQTQCDLSSSMSDLRTCYTAYVVSEPPEGAPAELMEYPHTKAPRFCPDQDTVILSPSFKLEVDLDQSTTTVHITDPLTAAFKHGHRLTIRDVFGEELEYKVTYWRNKSTGKKKVTSPSNLVELKGLDRGQSYCFQVQALVRSREPHSQLGSSARPSAQYSVVVIAGAVLLPLLVVAGLIAVIVICCRRKKKEQRTEKAQAQNVL
uniref:Tissue factor n=1 Tax=Neogobius melanostomus TaxID=47308 RepID=A0A8C6U823_9GOBI